MIDHARCRTSFVVCSTIYFTSNSAACKRKRSNQNMFSSLHKHLDFILIAKDTDRLSINPSKLSHLFHDSTSSATRHLSILTVPITVLAYRFNCRAFKVRKSIFFHDTTIYYNAHITVPLISCSNNQRHVFQVRIKSMISSTYYNFLRIFFFVLIFLKTIENLPRLICSIHHQSINNNGAIQ